MPDPRTLCEAPSGRTSHLPIPLERNEFGIPVIEFCLWRTYGTEQNGTQSDKTHRGFVPSRAEMETKITKKLRGCPTLGLFCSAKSSLLHVPSVPQELWPCRTRRCRSPTSRQDIFRNTACNPPETNKKLRTSQPGSLLFLSPLHPPFPLLFLPLLLSSFF